MLRFFEEIAQRQLPIWTVFTLSNDTVDKIQVLVFFMVWREDRRSHCSLMLVLALRDGIGDVSPISNEQVAQNP